MWRLIARALGVFSLFGLIGLLWWVTRPPPLTVQGEVSADRIDISARVPGRVLKLGAAVGDVVEPGTILAELENPQLLSQELAVRAALNVATADLARVNSTRPEVIDARRADLASADADVVLTQINFDRQRKLASTGNAPQSRVDEVAHNLEAATRKREAAEAALRLAIAGASPEERELAGAQVKQAEAALQQRQVDVGELIVRAPIRGQATTRVAEVGENFSAGAPLFSLIDIDNLWFTFNLREDLLEGLKIGEVFNVSVPALKGLLIPVRVTVINVQGQYATWRATRATGDFDLRTFEVRAVPVKSVEGLRPGMSAVVAWDSRNR